MEFTQELKNLVTDAKNICLIPSQPNEPESLSAALALFYTLKELGKNVNLIAPDFPAKLSFLVPSLDFISTPKNFVISIPRSVADISQVYYEKSDEHLKIHLTIAAGNIKKDNISFYFSDAKPDAIITLGIKNFHQELEGKLDSFGFLLDSPIINLDSQEVFDFNGNKNTNFGKINIVEATSLPQIVLETITFLNPNNVDKNTANCILAGLTLHYENFQNSKTTPEVFERCAQLMKQGANRQEILKNLYPQNTVELPQVPAPGNIAHTNF